jgi:hypothetical protein
MIAITTLTHEQGERQRAATAFALSVVLNAVALLLIAWWSVRSGGSSHGSPVLDSRSPLIVPEEEQRDDELRLGKRDATSASINWLGIDAPEEVLAQAPESEVDQAAQSTAPGDSPIPTDSAPAIEQAPSEQRPAQPAADPVPLQPEQTPTPTPEPEPEQAEPEPAQPEPNENAAPEPVPPSPIPSTDQSTQREDDELPEITNDTGIVVQDQTDGDADETTLATPAPTPEPTQSPSDQQPQEQPPSTEQPVTAPVGPPAPPIAALPSLRGIIADRDVIATAIKRAEKLDPDKSHQPIVGEGLEIKTVLSTGLLSAEARLYGAGANPVIVLEFNAKGRVAHAQYLRSFDREYNTGSRLLDEQLINMLFKWTASGARIDALDPANPRDTVQITIKILFRSEAPRP